MSQFFSVTIMSQTLFCYTIVTVFSVTIMSQTFFCHTIVTVFSVTMMSQTFFCHTIVTNDVLQQEYKIRIRVVFCVEWIVRANGSTFLLFCFFALIFFLLKGFFCFLSIKSQLGQSISNFLLNVILYFFSFLFDLNEVK